MTVETRAVAAVLILAALQTAGCKDEKKCTRRTDCAGEQVCWCKPRNALSALQETLREPALIPMISRAASA
jgi:hypothetical protein